MMRLLRRIDPRNDMKVLKQLWCIFLITHHKSEKLITRINLNDYFAGREMVYSQKFSLVNVILILPRCIFNFFLAISISLKISLIYSASLRVGVARLGMNRRRITSEPN